VATAAETAAVARVAVATEEATAAEATAAEVAEAHASDSWRRDSAGGACGLEASHRLGGGGRADGWLAAGWQEL